MSRVNFVHSLDQLAIDAVAEYHAISVAEHYQDSQRACRNDDIIDWLSFRMTIGSDLFTCDNVVHVH